MSIEESTDRIIEGIKQSDASLVALWKAVAELQARVGLNSTPEMRQKPASPVLEVIEYVNEVDEGDHSCVVPNAIKVNGQAILCTDDPITINDIDDSSFVTVTMTVIARRVVIEQREYQPDDAA